MANNEVNIKVGADTRQAESQIKKLADQLGKIENFSIKGSFKSATEQIKGLGSAIKDIGVRGATAGTIFGLPVALKAVGVAATSTAGKMLGLGAAMSAATAGVPQIIQQIISALGNVPTAWGAAAVAAMAFAPQILKATKATVSLGAAVDKAIGKQTTESIAKAVDGVGQLKLELQGVKATFDDLLDGSTLNQLNKQLSDAVKQSGAFHSSTVEAVTAAEQLASVMRQQKTEQKAINDLVRQAQGLQPQDVRDAELYRRKSALTSGRNAQKEQAAEQARLNAELEDYARVAAEVAAQTKAWADNLTRVERSSKAGVLGNKGQIQARLEEMRANNRSAQIARERSALIQGKAYGLNEVPAGGQLFPGGNTKTAQSGYRQMLNAQALTRQAAEDALKKTQAKTVLEGKSVQVLRTRVAALKDEAASNARSVAILREQNAERLKSLKLIEQAAAADARALTVARRQTQLADLKNKKKKGEDLQKRFENTLVSGAFPLLFGAGPGATLGGFAGGAIGGANPMIGVFTSALGQILDQFAAAAMDMGKALRDPITNFEKIKEAGLLASKSQEDYVQRLIEVGNVSKATAIIQGELIKKIGSDGVADLQRLGSASTELAKVWAELNIQLQAALAGPLAGLLNWVILLAKAANNENVKGAAAKVAGAGALTPGLPAGLIAKIVTSVWGAGTQVRGKQQSSAGTQLSPEAEVKAAEARLQAAERAEQLRRQGISLERQQQDLQLQVADQVYSFRQRAADLERQGIDLRRSVEERIFQQRQQLAKQESDNLRQRAQLRIERTDLALGGLRSFSNAPGTNEANALLDAARQYIRAKGEGEADLQAKEREFRIDMIDLERQGEQFAFEVARKVADLNRSAADYTRDVERAKLTTERAIYDLQIAAADYAVAKAKERIALETNAASQVQQTNNLTGQVSTPGNFTALSALIGSRESYGGNYGAFNRGGSNNGHTAHGSGIDPNLTGMSLAEIQRRQLAPGVPRNQQLHAVGKYQIIGSTLRSLLAGRYGPTGVKSTDLFTPDVQEKLGYALARNRVVPGDVGRTMSGLRSEWIGLQYAPNAQLAKAAQQLMSGGTAMSPIFSRGGAANNIVPTTPAPAQPASVGKAQGALGGLSAPGAPDISGLMAQSQQLQSALMASKEAALSMFQSMKGLKDVQIQQVFQQAGQTLIQQLKEPLDSALQSATERLQVERNYARLITEGVAPEAARITVELEQQVALQLRKVDAEIAMLNSLIEAHRGEAAITAELEKQLAARQALKGELVATGQQAISTSVAANDQATRNQQAESDARGLAGTLTGGLKDAIKAAVTGGDVKAALSNMLGSLGERFLDMAFRPLEEMLTKSLNGMLNPAAAQQMQAGTVMLQASQQQMLAAQQMATAGAAGGGGGFGGIGGLLGGLFGGGGGLGAAASGIGFNPIAFTPGLSFFADGGFVTGPTQATIGEGGANEYVIPANKMPGAMARWSAGARGDAVINGADPTSGGGVALADQPPQVTITGGVLNFNDSQYIKADQIPMIVREGAKQGEAQALRRMQMSPSVRRKLGMN